MTDRSLPVSTIGARRRRRVRLFTRAQPAVEIELIAMLFSTVVPPVVAGAVATLVAVQAGWNADPRTVALCLLVLASAFARLAVVQRFRARSVEGLDLQMARLWERRYAWSSYAMSATLGIANLNALHIRDPIISMLIVGVMFAYTFSLALRVSVRPTVCLISVAITLAPTAFGILAYIPPSDILTPALAAAAALTIILALSGSGFAMVRYTYNLLVSQISARNILSQVARQDALTGLVNRIGLRERFDEEMAGLARGRVLAVHYLDLDRFKSVNDSNGHQVGDALLRQVANRMAMSVRAGDVVSRLGGDEFVILQCDIGSAADAQVLAQALIAAVSEVYTIEGLRLWVGATIGIALAPQGGQALDTLLASADSALYRAKRDGRGTYAFAEDGGANERRVA